MVHTVAKGGRKLIISVCWMQSWVRLIWTPPLPLCHSTPGTQLNETRKNGVRRHFLINMALPPLLYSRMQTQVIISPFRRSQMHISCGRGGEWHLRDIFYFTHAVDDLVAIATPRRLAQQVVAFALSGVEGLTVVRSQKASGRVLSAKRKMEPAPNRPLLFRFSTSASVGNMLMSGTW